MADDGETFHTELPESFRDIRCVAGERTPSWGL
jgi:hypothetical protein